MIFAAGLGTRLGALGERRPKALIPIAGVPMLERVARRLIDAGADRLVINVHHHADAIREFVERRASFGVDVAFSVEEDAPLETGGGLLAAAPLLRRDGPILLHNVDVLSDVDLGALLKEHNRTKTLATLAVNAREASRYLLFDERGLCGYAGRDGREVAAREAVGSVERFGFTGIHAIAPEFLDRITETGVFSIMTSYLRLAGAGAAILPFDASAAFWLDIGTPERLETANRLLGG